MEVMADDQTQEQQIEAMNNYLLKRKNKIHEILMQKRSIASKNKQLSQQIIASEDKEVEVEESSRKGYLSLCTKKNLGHIKCAGSVNLRIVEKGPTKKSNALLLSAGECKSQLKEDENRLHLQRFN